MLKKTIGGTLGLVATLCLSSAAFGQTYTGIQDAIPIGVQLQGNTKTDGWYNLSASPKTKTVDGVEHSFGPNTGFPGALNSSARWPNAIDSQLQSDATKKAALNKISNGDGSGYSTGYNSNWIPNSLNGFNTNGTPNGGTWTGSGYGSFPSGEGLYAISFSNFFNGRQNTLGVFEANPILNLKNVVFQVEIGGANGYDFWNPDVESNAETAFGTIPSTLGLIENSAMYPQLTITLATNEKITLTADFSALLARGYNGSIEVPSGDEEIWINLYGFQWDLSEYTNITSYVITFTPVEHSTVYALQLDQSDVFTQAVPEPSTWLLLGLGVTALLVFRNRLLRAN